MARLRLSALPVVDAHLGTVVFLPAAVERLHGDPGFFADLWSGFFVRDGHFNLPQHRHDSLWFVPLGHDSLFLQVDSLSFLVTNFTAHVSRTLRNAHALFVAFCSLMLRS
jgi:hypothetical protein